MSNPFFNPKHTTETTNRAALPRTHLLSKPFPNKFGALAKLQDTSLGCPEFLLKRPFLKPHCKGYYISMFQKAQYLILLQTQINLEQISCHNTFVHPPLAVVEQMIVN